MRLPRSYDSDPLRDIQQDPILGECTECGGELYTEQQLECGLCYYCQKEMEE